MRSFQPSPRSLPPAGLWCGVRLVCVCVCPQADRQGDGPYPRHPRTQRLHPQTRPLDQDAEVLFPGGHRVHRAGVQHQVRFWWCFSRTPESPGEQGEMCGIDGTPRAALPSMFLLPFDYAEVYITATVRAEWIMESEACGEAGDVCSARWLGSPRWLPWLQKCCRAV